tara:strand:+ start:1756 stop:2019 length:264 start_codon:yes stop_codon:yes gene_type:complete
MVKYYCPYCSFRYQFHKIKGNGKLICVHCGEHLIKQQLINSKRLIGVVVAFAFLAPLVLMIIFVINDITKEKLPINSESLVQLYLDK